jgi:hypothetical protein
MLWSARVFLGVLALAAAPASAATYTGTLNGIITSGEFGFYDGYSDATPVAYTTDLTGTPISIDFTSTVINNYTDSLGYLIPRFVSNTISVTIADPDPNFTNLRTFRETQSNDLNYYGGIIASSDSNFTGNASAGHLTMPASTVHVGGGLDFIFAGASPNAGPLSGSGSANAYNDPPVPLSWGYNVKFQLTDGFVQMTGTPEPESWALMILGFGGIGAMLRARRQQVSRRSGLAVRGDLVGA